MFVVKLKFREVMTWWFWVPMECQLHSLAAYIVVKDSFTYNKQWICLNLNLITHETAVCRNPPRTVLQDTEKLGISSADQNLATLHFYENMKSNFFVKFYIFHSVHYNSVCTISTNRCTQLLYDSQCCK